MHITIIAALVVFGLLVLVHELGHFIVAKKTGMLVREFAIGFGPKIYSVKRGETEYSLRCIPLGGFNDIAGMDSDDDDAGERSYCARPLCARFAVIVAGAAMNLSLPIFLFWGIFFFAGIIAPSPEPIFGEIVADSPAERAGLLAGDLVRKVNGTEMTSWTAFVEKVRASGGQEISLEIEREGQILTLPITPEYNAQEKRAIIGVRNAFTIEYHSFTQSFIFAVERNFRLIKRMVVGLAEIASGERAGEVSGPIGIVKMTGEMAEAGFLSLVNFVAILSLNLGVVNLLPIPALDGGHVIVLLLEGLRGKPLGKKALEYTQMVGVACLVALMVFATKNDIVRIFFSQ